MGMSNYGVQGYSGDAQAAVAWVDNGHPMDEVLADLSKMIDALHDDLADFRGRLTPVLRQVEPMATIHDEMMLADKPISMDSPHVQVIRHAAERLGMEIRELEQLRSRLDV